MRTGCSAPFFSSQAVVAGQFGLFYSILIKQVPVTASYPDHLSLSAWMCFMAALQSASVTFFLEKDPSAWKLHSVLQLGCCLYAVSISALGYLSDSSHQ
ncbi:hypothetical protein C3L33_05588, partial [Rhododendron williamsianum]